jgi:hypothetical protein
MKKLDIRRLALPIWSFAMLGGVFFTSCEKENIDGITLFAENYKSNTKMAVEGVTST